MPYIPRTEITAAAVEAGVDTSAPPVTGRWYRRSLANGLTTGTRGLDILDSVRILLGAGTLDRIAAKHEASPTASEVLRLGIYIDDEGRPGSLLLDAGTIDLSTATGIKSITISQSIVAGYYWLASVRQGPTNTATMTTAAGDLQKAGVESWDEVAAADLGCIPVMAQTSVSGALPNPFVVGFTLGHEGTMPIVAVRYA